jgi:hypothetical protein
MEARIYKPKRLQNGKRTTGRLYRARIKLAGDSKVRDIALQVYAALVCGFAAQ